MELREQIEANIKGAESGASSGQADVVVSDASADSTTSSAAPIEDAAGVSGPSETGPAPTRARDASGKFAKASESATEPPTQGQVTKTKAGDTSPAPLPAGTVPPLPGGDSLAAPAGMELKAPQSWKPQAREKWATLPPEVQAEAVRIDTEVRKTMQEAAPAKRFVQEVAQVLEPLTRARGVTPGQLISSYAQADQMLSHPDPHTKAQAVASLMKSYGVSVEALDAILSGQPAPQGQQPHIDPAQIAAQAEQRVFDRLNQQREQAAQARFEREVSTFAADPTNEFFQDVLPEMTAIVQAGKARGVEVSLKDAYDRSVWANPELRAIVQQREQAKAAATTQVATQKAAAAGSSIRNQPASPVNAGKAGDLRTDILASIAKLGGRQ